MAIPTNDKTWRTLASNMPDLKIPDMIKTPDIWTTKEGERIPIYTMEASHIRHCIHQLNRKRNKLDKEYHLKTLTSRINMFKDELKTRKTDIANEILTECLLLDI